jgi:hypothetical protein
LKKKEEEAQGDDEDDVGHGNINRLNINHISLKVFNRCQGSVPAEGRTKAHSHQAVNEVKNLLAPSAESGDNQFDGNVFAF